MYKEDARDYRECVCCGFKDEMRFKLSSRELETRVNVPDAIKKAETQVLILDPSRNKSE